MNPFIYVAIERLRRGSGGPLASSPTSIDARFEREDNDEAPILYCICNETPLIPICRNEYEKQRMKQRKEMNIKFRINSKL